MLKVLKDNSVLKQMMIDNILKVKDKEIIFKRMTSLQNEISVNYDSKVIAVTSINQSDLASAFATAFGQTFALNDYKTLIIDANLYNPCLESVLAVEGEKTASDVEVLTNEPDENYKIIFVDKNLDAVCLKKETYPSEIYKGGLIHKIVKENKDKYDRFVLLVPEMKKHKEVLLLKDLVTAIVLVTQSGLTKKGDIFDALKYCAENKLPMAKTVVIK